MKQLAVIGLMQIPKLQASVIRDMGRHKYHSTDNLDI